MLPSGPSALIMQLNVPNGLQHTDTHTQIHPWSSGVTADITSRAPSPVTMLPALDSISFISSYSSMSLEPSQ
ncbi:hypothetical protein A6R68_18284, partial [Neotoma lepida]